MIHVNKILTQIIAMLVVALFSMGAYAGGANCDSKKGHKEMSVEQMQELKDKHHWIFSDDAVSNDEGVTEGNKIEQDRPKSKSTSNKLMGV